MQDVEQFNVSRKWYVDRGIPHRRGYLFYGPPGGGKSSFAFALASHLSLPIYSVSLNNEWATDTTLDALLMNIQDKAILLLEDIDALFSNRESKTKITFSGLLNVIDGISAAEGRILIMTTNHPEKLDEALIRKGRVDFRAEFSYADDDQLERVFKLFYFLENDDNIMHDVLAKAFVKSVRDAFKKSEFSSDVSMAEVQNHLIAFKDSYQKAIDSTFIMIEERTQQKNAKPKQNATDVQKKED